MSEGISAPFIRYPIGTSLLMAGILFVGLVAYPLLPVAPLPQVDFPTIQVSANLPGAQPRNHGLLGRAAAGAAVRADSRRRADDLDELAGHGRDHHPVRPQPQHRRRRQRRAGGDQRRGRPVAEEPAARRRPTARSTRPNSPILLLSATSDTLPLTDGRATTSTPSSRSRSARSPASPRSSSAASRSRRSGSRSIRPSWSPRACRWRTSAARSRSRRSTARRATSTATTRAYTIYANDQLTDVEGLERRHHRLSQRRPVADPRYRPGGHRA